jgi:hypothetical protein
MQIASALGREWLFLAKNVEFFRMYGISQGIFAINMALTDDVEKGLLHREGTSSPGHGYFLMQMLYRIPPNVLAGSVADHQEFRDGNASS